MFSDPIGQSLAISRKRANDCTDLSPEGAVEIILSEIEIFLRCGDPIARAIAAAVRESVISDCSSADEVLTLAIKSYSITTDPDNFIDVVMAF